MEGLVNESAVQRKIAMGSVLTNIVCNWSVYERLHLSNKKVLYTPLLSH